VGVVMESRNSKSVRSATALLQFKSVRSATALLQLQTARTRLARPRSYPHPKLRIQFSKHVSDVQARVA
jgi:hypothetical protein